jgi:hypothetical protein
LLKDLSDKVEEQDNETRERIIQNGGHYSEMLPIEYKPKDEYMEVFYKILEKETRYGINQEKNLHSQICRQRGNR